MPVLCQNPLAGVLPDGRAMIVSSMDKNAVLDQLVSMLAGTPGVPVTREELKAAVLAREQLMSTGIGLGLAFPHVRMKKIEKLSAAAVLVRDSVPDYESMDSVPVRFVMMILAPEGQHAQYLRLLAAISSRLKETGVAEKLFAAAEPADIQRLLTGENH